MFWIRLACTIFTMTFAGMTKLATFAPNFDAPVLKRLSVAFGASVAYVATALVAAHVFVFPIPMIWILGGSFMSMYVPGMALLVFGYAPFAKKSPCRQSLQCFSRYFFSYMTLAGVFPFYKVLYEIVPKNYRGIVIIVLPLWRLAAKQFMVKATRELEDFMPEIVAFTVDYFSALFVSVCMSTSGSLDLAVLFIAADVGQSLLELYEVREVSKSLKKILRQDSTHGLQLSKPSSDDLVSMLLDLAQDPNNFQQKSRLWACLPHPISREQAQRLEALDTFCPGVPSLSAVQIQKKSPHRERLFQKSPIVPVSALPGPTPSEILKVRADQPNAVENQRTKSKHVIAAESSKKVVERGMRALFHWEYAALVEYVECIVPLVFVAYKTVLQQLPNVVYYPGGSGSFKADSAMNILLFGALEVGSFLLLSRFLLRKFVFSPLYQLGFVLETQMCSIQTKLFIETVLLLQYELAHFGTDFSFRFEWLQDKR